MTMVGGNLEQMLTLQRCFTSDAQAVADLRQRISTNLSGTSWTGPAAQRFREDWNSTFVPALNQLHDALTQNSTVVRNRTDAIRTATS
jgi:uncharacterized protein YukE